MTIFLLPDGLQAKVIVSLVSDFQVKKNIVEKIWFKKGLVVISSLLPGDNDENTPVK